VILDFLGEVTEDAGRNLTQLACRLHECEPVTSWRWLPEKVTGLDVLTALGAVGSFVALVFGAAAIFQSAKARNLSTIIELTKQIYEERQRAHDLKLFSYEDHEMHAFQMLHLVEQASMIVNHRMVSGKSREFLMDWLREELPAMAAQEAYREGFSIANGPQLKEMRKLYRELFPD
jgi:hypothetical protein